MDTCSLNETGKIYGRWLVLEPAPKPAGLKSEGAYWLCECQCSAHTRKVIRGSTLRQGLSLSCGCYKQESLSKIRKADTPYFVVLQKYRSTAHRRGHPFALTIDDIKRLVVQDCWYCGAKPANTDQFLKAKHNFHYNGIDRMDNTKGYTSDNCVPCCTRCNKAKLDQTLDQFREWVAAVYQRTATASLTPSHP